MSVWHEVQTPVVRGVTLLEASAGTGKTWNITSLVLRLLVEHDVPVSEILVVTFTRAATQELRERIRLRLGAAVKALEGREPSPQDALLRAWVQHPPQGALERLHQALVDLDRCLISTIHGFCQRMLQAHAFESDAELGVELREDVSDLVQDAVQDVLSRSLYAVDREEREFLQGSCGFNRKSLGRIAWKLVDDPEMAVLPEIGSVGSLSERLGALVDWRQRAKDLADLWEQDWEDLADEAQKAHASKVVFTSTGQRTYTHKTVSGAHEAVERWLREQRVPPAHWGSLKGGGAKARNYSEWTLAAKRAEGETWSHPLIEGVSALMDEGQALVDQCRALAARELRRGLEERTRGARIWTYQDLLQNLGKVLGDDSHPSHEALRKALGGRFQAALIDEFQDTDALQWTLFRTAFGDLDHFLFLIGDPKQAIYGFRGANLAVYKAARAAAGGNRFTMTVNHRSDQRLLEALEHWMGRPGFFGDPDIDFVSVHAPPEHVPDRLRWPQCSRTEPFCAPLQVRFFDKGMSPVAVPGSSIEQLAKGDLNRWLPGRIAADIVGLLDSGAEIKDGEDWRDLGPGDLAVLVRKNREGRGVLRALTQAGVPAVLAGADSVFASDEAVQLQFWLKALAAPNASRAARTAAVSPLSGWQAEHLGRVDAEDPEAMAWWDEWIASLVDWQQGLEKRGLMASFRRLLAYVGPDPKGRTGLERLLSWPDGERRLTNWLHLAELAHQAQVRERLQLSGLLAWLQAERETSSLEKEAVEARLESDAAAVKVLTMHKSKGLQYPVVFAPYLWDGMVFQQGEDAALVVPSDQDPCERVLDLHRDPKAAPKAIHKAVAERERREEALRLLYVALTRARHRVVVYTGAVAGFPNSPLAAALHGDGGSDRLEKGQERSAFKPCSIRLDQVVEALAGSASSDDGTALASVSRCAPLTPVRWTPPLVQEETLFARNFKRPGIARHWRRWSYSGLHPTHGEAPVALGRTVASPEPLGKDRDGAVRIGEAPDVLLGTHEEPIPLDTWPANAVAGTCLHSVLEHLDFTLFRPGADVAVARSHLECVATEHLEVAGFDVATCLPPLLEHLPGVLNTPLGGDGSPHAAPALTLAGIPGEKRLDELRFDLALAGGDAYRAGQDEPVQAGDVVAWLRKGGGSPALPVSYLEHLGLKGRLAGYLTGFIDLVFEHQGRFYVVDHKSNRLTSAADRRSRPSDYALAGLVRAMEHRHYYLQYHLYAVAVHRFLGERIPDYDYDSCFGGVYYLFLRGMTGPETPQVEGRRHGVFFDRPRRETIEGLSALFTGQGGSP